MKKHRGIWRRSVPVVFQSIVATLIMTFTLGGCSVFGVRSGTEQPSYTVVETLAENIEIRRYPRRLSADVVVEGDEASARSAGFRKLFGYISGENRARQSLEMTAPVGQTSSQRIKMTAPVGQGYAGPGEWRIRFLMPDGYTADTLPEPTDPGIFIREVEPTTVAVIRFSGSRSPVDVHLASGQLQASLKNSGWRPVGSAEALFYDPPWTLAFLRRNEVAIAVRRHDEASVR